MRIETTRTPSIRTCSAIVAGFAVVILGVTPRPASGSERDTAVTFNKDIAPILQRSCQRCHRPEGYGPMALISYKDVRPWARSIKNRTAAREMPPWFIDKHIGIQRYKDDPSLSDAEIAAIATWVDNGAPQGDPADLPPPREWVTGGWTYGTPDLIVSSPEGTVAADAADWFGEWGNSPTGLTEDRYVKAMEVREIRLDEESVQEENVDSSGRADLGLFVVHHAVITAATPEQVIGANGPVSASEDALWITYELGQNSTIFPADVGVTLPAESVVTFDSMHLHSIGKEARARLDVGFTFHPKGYQPKYDQRSGGLRGATHYDYEFDIPSNDDNVMQDGFHRLTQPTKMLTFEPHLHASGKRMCVEALYPNNAREMLSCADYDHNWVKVYVYEDDVAPLLPEGTLIHIMAWYDNSATNKNVIDWRNWKGYGNRSVDDMFVGITRMVYMSEEEFNAEVAERGGTPAFVTSQDQ